MPECAYCSGELYRYDEVYPTADGWVHFECLYDYLKHAAAPIDSGVCGFCGEEISGDGLLAADETFHEDCLLDYSIHRFRLEFEG